MIGSPNWVPTRTLRQIRGPYRREAEAIYRLQLRADIASRMLEGQTPKQIADALGISTQFVGFLHKQSKDRSLAVERIWAERRRQTPDDRRALPRVLPWKREKWHRLRLVPRMTVDPTPTRALVHQPTTPYPPPPPPGSTPSVGTVLDPPEIRQLRKEVLDLRKRALPYSIIADTLGITEEEAKLYCKQEIHRIGDDELADVGLARRVQVEQIDAMIAAIYDAATGSTAFDDPDRGRPVSHEAIDRMVKLLDAKAKLLGLNAPQRIDIDQRLLVMAEELGADVDEIREIAVEVLEKYQPGLSGR